MDGVVIDRHGPGDCSKCPTRDMCKTLCSEAEALANRDYVKQEHILVGDQIFNFQDCVTENDIFKKLKLTNTEHAVLRLVLLNVNRNTILQSLGITANSFYFHVHNIKKKAKKAKIS